MGKWVQGAERVKDSASMVVVTGKLAERCLRQCMQDPEGFDRALRAFVGPGEVKLTMCSERPFHEAVERVVVETRQSTG